MIAEGTLPALGVPVSINITLDRGKLPFILLLLLQGPPFPQLTVTHHLPHRLSLLHPAFFLRGLAALGGALGLVRPYRVSARREARRRRCCQSCYGGCTGVAVAPVGFSFSFLLFRRSSFLDLEP